MEVAQRSPCTPDGALYRVADVACVELVAEPGTLQLTMRAAQRTRISWGERQCCPAGPSAGDGGRHYWLRPAQGRGKEYRLCGGPSGRT